jgi:hypothetical protein
VTLSCDGRAVPTALARTTARIVRALHPGAATEIRRARSGVVQVVALAAPRGSVRPAGGSLLRPVSSDS